MAVVAAGLFQLIIGVLGSFFGVAPRLADAAHRHFGHVVMAAAAAQLVLGVWRLQDVHALYWLLGAWAAALLIAVVALTLREHANKDRPLDSASRSASGEIILQQLAELGDKEAIASVRIDGRARTFFRGWGRRKGLLEESGTEMILLFVFYSSSSRRTSCVRQGPTRSLMPLWVFG